MDKDYDPSLVWRWKEDSEHQWETREEALLAVLENATEAEFDDYIETVGYIERWEFVTAHLTEKAAHLYIQQNKHNMTEPRVYVSSQHRCHEFNQLIDLLMAKGEENAAA